MEAHNALIFLASMRTDAWMRIPEPYDRYAVLSAALKGRRLGYLLIQLIIESAAPEGRNPLRQCQL
jgi:hypothetical protein